MRIRRAAETQYCKRSITFIPDFVWGIGRDIDGIAGNDFDFHISQNHHPVSLDDVINFITPDMPV